MERQRRVRIILTEAYGDAARRRFNFTHPLLKGNELTSLLKKYRASHFRTSGQEDREYFSDDFKGQKSGGNYMPVSVIERMNACMDPSVSFTIKGNDLDLFRYEANRLRHIVQRVEI